ncbi:tRNA (guanosine(37)-N1)-methyltransferase TrmD [bacterium]|jgi:tRNA (guanine37-N1)-methyltransferase|nr:tRNA (guanosine(37)-N1)-methyltransferase TrmD [bacterium]|tara:strand:+ start:239 stop:1003 length:765 start_codon:yes stop_codon:yes gene_type:complete
MKIGLITLFPEMFDALLEYGISSRAVKNGLFEVKCFNPRAYAVDYHNTVDDRPYGGGPGMVLMAEPLRKSIKEARNWIGAKTKVIYLSPQGQVLTQKGVQLLSSESSLIFISGRYEGVDERVIDLEVDEEWSIGDYVLSGGELPTMVVMDTIIRQLPGALGDQLSAKQDSFSEGLLDYPHYTRPETYEGLKVPDILLSGNHENIRQWRLKESLKRTLFKRPELLSGLSLNKEQEEMLDSLMKDSISKESTDESN